MSQVTKLNQVNSKLGATMSGQQTTRYIYDTVTSALGQTKFDFFNQFSGKGEFETNLTTNKLDSSESMVIKSIYMSCSAANGFLNHCKLNITVGNQVVIKDMDVSFNSGVRGLAFDRLHGSNFANSQNFTEVRLLTDIVIPPQVSFSATFETSNTGFIENDLIVLGLKGYGVIFSAGNTF